jgi:hypothetical protein
VTDSPERRRPRLDARTTGVLALPMRHHSRRCTVKRLCPGQPVYISLISRDATRSSATRHPPDHSATPRTGPVKNRLNDRPSISAQLGSLLSRVAAIVNLSLSITPFGLSCTRRRLRMSGPAFRFSSLNEFDGSALKRQPRVKIARKRGLLNHESEQIALPRQT